MSRLLANRYELGEVLGEGGMAVVHLAVDQRLGRRVAVKVLREQFASDREFLARFEREAQAAAALSHPSIVAVFDVGSDGDTHFIVMEYVPGEDLKTLIRREAPLRSDRIVSIGTQLCQALDYAHRQGVIHRDVKPHNVLLTPSGEVKVADFGIAVALGAPSLTQSGVVLGTAQYIAPEQALGESNTPASDIYSAGVLLFELATGRVPFQAENLIAVARMHVDQQPPVPSRLNPQLPGTLDWVVLRALAKEPSARFTSAGEMARALEAHASLAGERTMQLPVPVDAGTLGRGGPEQGNVASVAAPPRRPVTASPVPRHVVPRPRQRDGQSAWPIVVVSGLALAAVIALIPFGLAWLQDGGSGSFGRTSPTHTLAPTRTALVVAPPAEPTATQEPRRKSKPRSTKEPSPTTTSEPSPTPTQAPTSTPTPRPTERPTPTPTSTPVPPSPTLGPVRMPTVRGMRIEDARAQLGRMGLEVRDREVKHVAPAGIVVNQSPESGELLQPGSTVTLFVSRGD